MIGEKNVLKIIFTTIYNTYLKIVNIYKCEKREWGGGGWLKNGVLKIDQGLEEKNSFSAKNNIFYYKFKSFD